MNWAFPWISIWLVVWNGNESNLNTHHFYPVKPQQVDVGGGVKRHIWRVVFRGLLFPDLISDIHFHPRKIIAYHGKIIKEPPDSFTYLRFWPCPKGRGLWRKSTGKPENRILELLVSSPAFKELGRCHLGLHKKKVEETRNQQLFF